MSLRRSQTGQVQQRESGSTSRDSRGRGTRDLDGEFALLRAITRSDSRKPPANIVLDLFDDEPYSAARTPQESITAPCAGSLKSAEEVARKQYASELRQTSSLLDSATKVDNSVTSGHDEDLLALMDAAAIDT
jgi:hypothetical protein